MEKKRILLLILMLSMTFLQASALYYIKDIKVGEYLYLRPNITSYGRSYSWSYEGGDRSCVSVTGMYSGSTSANVRGLKPGWVIIQCDGYSQDGTRYYYDTWEINVADNKPESVTITPSSIEIDLGATANVSASVKPTGAEYSYINWGSVNASVASVSGSGTSAMIKGLAVGSTTISATTDNGVKGTCSVKVWGTSPTSISISGESSLYIGYIKQMAVNFTPSTHHSTITWSSDKPSVAVVNQNGVVTGTGSGTAVIMATTANGLSATKTITVTEPPFTLESTSPNNNETDVTLFQHPSATYSLPVYSGTQASQIKLYAGSASNKVDGEVNIAGNSVTFIPARALQPNKKYTFLIPANGVKNQWGTGYSKDVSFSFTTGDAAPMTLTAYLKAGYVEAGEELELDASEGDAEIRYTTDGSEPSERSTLYTSPIVINKSVTIWARAYKDGYVTPEYKGTYKISHVHVTEKYPVGDQLYKYKDVNPYIAFEVNMKEGPNFQDLSIEREDGQEVDGRFILHQKRLVFVPAHKLELGHTYTIYVPEDAVEAINGEPNKDVEWSFTSGEFVRSISAGYQQAAAVKTDNTLWYWGKQITQYQGGDCIVHTPCTTPHLIESEINNVSCGFTHNLFTTIDDQVYGWGLQFCGEIGGGNLCDAAPFRVSGENASFAVAGGQNSAILKDGTIRMAGRNDYGQVGRTTQMAYSRFQDATLSDIKQIALGWETILALQENGTLYGWGNNAHKLLADGTTKSSESPKQIMTGIKTMAISKWDNTNVAVVKEDGTLWTWGLNDAGQIGDGTNTQPEAPVQVMEDVSAVAVGNHFMAAIDADGALWTWGDNSSGQLGDGSTVSTSRPHKVMEEVESIELGNNFAVALKEDGSVWTWGANDFYQLGNGYLSAYDATPKQIFAGRERKEFEGVQIMDTSLEMMPNDQAVICAKPIPLQANYHEWSWSSSDESVATVDERGVVTAVSLGTAIITLTSDNGEKAQCTVSVVEMIDGIKNVSTLPKTFDVYNLQGHKVRSNATDLKGLAKGIYIINGQKIQVK